MSDLVDIPEYVKKEELRELIQQWRDEAEQAYEQNAHVAGASHRKCATELEALLDD